MLCQGSGAGGTGVRTGAPGAGGGSGTVVTGTLGAGTLRVGDELELLDEQGHRASVQVRGLHSQDVERAEVGPVSRAAVNPLSVAISAKCSASSGARNVTVTADDP